MSHKGKLNEVKQATVTQQSKLTQWCQNTPYDHFIVSISQLYVRHIVWGKQTKPVELGAKLSVSLADEGFARVDHLRRDAFHEWLVLKNSGWALYISEQGIIQKRYWQIQYIAHKKKQYLKQKDIDFTGKPMDRSKKVTNENREKMKQQKAQRRAGYLQAYRHWRQVWVR